MKKKTGNQGSTLLVVIVVVSFITILGAVTLSMSAVNLQMKSTEVKAKRNFYNAEAALDELKAGLIAELSGIVEQAYTKTMVSYSSESLGERDAYFKKYFLENYLKHYARPDALPAVISFSNGTVKYETERLEKLLDKTKENTRIVSHDSGVMVWNYEKKNADKQYILFKNITVEYENQEGFLSKITTDIKVRIPDVNMESIGTLPAFTEYALIADRKIDALASDISVKGNIFAGPEGINVVGAGNKLNVQANRIITKDRILAKSGASIKFENLVDEEAHIPLDVWAKNIETGINTESTSSGANISVNGNLYIADDTTLNESDSTVTYKGSYYGYGYADNPKGSSALIVNRNKCNLDLSGIENLFVAGRAYIEPLEIMDKTTKTYTLSGDYVQTGESISMKASQAVYRLPADALAAKTNPMPVSEYNAIDKNNMVKLSYQIVPGGNPLSHYVNSEQPYKTIFDTTSSTPYVYVYPNFSSAAKANEYMKDICKNGSIGVVKERLQQYDSNIKLPDNLKTERGRKTFAGNLLAYQKGTPEGIFTLYENSVDAKLPQQFATESDQLGKMYNAYCKRLLPTLEGEEGEYDTIFDALILDESGNEEHPGFFEMLGSEKEKLVSDSEYGSAYLVNNEESTLIVDGSVASDVSLIVATGDVKVERNFKGLIISKGTITFEKGVEVTADSSALFKLISHTKVKSIFRDYNSFGTELTTNDNTEVSFEKLVGFENWRKE